MHYRYTFLYVNTCEEVVLYDLDAEGIYKVMMNPGIILSYVEKVNKVE